MKRSVDELQHYLGRLESGAALGDLLDQLPEDHAEFAPLLSVAHALSEAPDPLPDAAAARRRDERIRAAIAARAAHPPQPAGAFWLRWRLPKLHIAPLLQFSGGLITLLLLVVAAWALFARGPLDSPMTAQLTESVGAVEISGGADSSWRAMDRETVIEEGQSIRTGRASTARLTFFEGSELFLAPESELTILKLAAHDASLALEIQQRRGKTSHEVVPLQGDEAAYVVRTPGGAATVHGTSFSVVVSESGESEFAVNEGEVEIAASGTRVVLRSGQLTHVSVGEPPALPQPMQQNETATPASATPTSTTQAATATATATTTPSATPSLTPTPQASLTPEMTSTPEATTTPAAGSCTGADPHPQGMELAQRYGVSYEEIMGWFCAGFGFGEIDMAYGLASRTGSSVGEIFDMRTSGMGWGQIRQELGDLPGGPPENPGPPGGGPPNGGGPPGNPGPPGGPPGGGPPGTPPGRGRP